MNRLLRWGKFNLVGALGMGLQLAALAAFARWVPGHYLIATAAAIELTLLHNFVWHLHFTWRDRRNHSAVMAQLIRFQLSNGMVSLVGNLGLMRVLVDGAHVPHDFPNQDSAENQTEPPAEHRRGHREKRHEGYRSSRSPGQAREPAN